jgi:transcriptional regulator with XRE-family HTH domain
MMTPLRDHANQQRFVQQVSDVHRTCGWSLREVATLTGLDHSYIWQIVNGHRRPSRDTLILLCLYGWSLDLPEANQLLETCGHKPLARTRSARPMSLSFHR